MVENFLQNRAVADGKNPGEIIAWLESTKLGEAKVQYLAKQSEVSCCSIELVRAQTTGAYTESIGIGPELMQNRYVIPAPHPRITVRGKLCAGRQSNQPRINAAYGCGQSCSSNHESATSA